MNQKQKDMLDYMREVVRQEDDYFFEAWKLVEWHVLDALGDVNQEENINES